MSEVAGPVPPVAVSRTTTEVTRTGSWKYIRPVYRDLVAPCMQACPVGSDIEGYLDLLRRGLVEEAADLVVRENPMPAVTGRVCPHPCEPACNRSQFDQAVAIHAVERWLGDRVLERAPVAPERRWGARVAVVGSGPAGLACAYHLVRLGYGVTVFEAAPEPGGMLRWGIPEYRLPRGVLERQVAWIAAHGVDFRCGVRVGVDLPWDGLVKEFDAVFLACGAQRSRLLGVPGEQLAGVHAGLDFLRAVNGGERPVVGRHVVVVGGGNTAMDCARTAIRLGAEVTVVYRRSRAEMPAIAEEVEEAEREGVQFVFLAAPIGFEGSEGRVHAVHCRRFRLGEPDASGRRAPVPVDGEELTLPAEVVLVAIGEVVELSGRLPGLEPEAAGLPADEYGQTSRPGWFAGGDLVPGPRTVADALGAGKRAAIGIDRYLRGLAGRGAGGGEPAELRYGARGNLSITRWRGDDPIPRVAPVNRVVTYQELNPRHFQPALRQVDGRLDLEASRRSFAEVNLGLDTAEVRAEVARCFNCGVCNGCDLCLVFCPDVAIARRDGRYRVALEYCKGCGICAAECPRGAIAMVQEEA